MKIVCDDQIPYIQPALQTLADIVVVKPGRDICAADVADADILVVRTRTHCDYRLLQGSIVCLVVTATIGYDHLDTHWMENHGIAWANCPGCNATSVAQYVLCCLLAMEQERNFHLRDATVGIVGVGHVGNAVLHALQTAGVRHILLNDPPRKDAGEAAPDDYEWSPLDRLQAEADVITLHTPLTQKGIYATAGLCDETFFKGLRRMPVFINAARGGIVDELALSTALDRSQVREAIIDTWEREPAIRRSLLYKAFIATPHIAGYSADGKANATRMVLERICRFLGKPMEFDIHPPALPSDLRLSDKFEERALQLYDPRRDSQQLKNRPETFEQLRENYPLRREKA